MLNLANEIQSEYAELGRDVVEMLETLEQSPELAELIFQHIKEITALRKEHIKDFENLAVEYSPVPDDISGLSNF